MGDQPPERIVVLDGLRVVGALMVATYDYVFRPQAGIATLVPGLHSVARFGWLGIALFFVISGFVICLSSWERNPAEFVRSRVIRLFPAFWPAVLITGIVLHLWPVVVPPIRASDLLVNLTMLQQPAGAPGVDGAYWALWTEIRFYLLFLLLVWRGLTIQRTTIFAYAWLVAAALAVSSGERWLVLVLQPAYAPLFVAGIAFSLIYKFGSSLVRWGLVAASFLLAQHSLQQAPETRGWLVIVVVAAFFAILAVVALGRTSRLRWRWLTTAGLLTYPFYLLHQVLGWTLIHYLRGWLPPYVLLLSVLTLMVLAAALVHYVIERPVAAALKDRWSVGQRDQLA